MDISAAIVSHNRKKGLLNTIYQLENQIVPFKEIKLYVSGYEDGELAELEKKYKISYERDMKDWGHDKRAKAVNECTTKYILCASDDDVYTYHFTEAVYKYVLSEPGGQVYATDWRTQRESHTDYFGYHIAEPRMGGVTSGCMVLDAEFVRSKDCYTFRDFGADGRMCTDIVSKGGKFVRVPYICFFHY